MPTTARGYPYPNPGDPADVAADIQALAASIDADISGYYINLKDHGAVGNGTTDDRATLQASIDAAPAGSVFVLPPATYKITTSELTFSKAMTVLAYGATINQTTAGAKGITITGSDVDIHGLTLTGPGGGSSNSTSFGINATGASTGARISRVKIRDCKVSGWRQYGIYAYFVDYLSVLSTIVTDQWYAGIMLLSCNNFLVSGNDVSETQSTSAPCYGIAAARYELGVTLVTDPECSDGRIVDNHVTNVELWEGIDTHSGQRIVIANNVVEACHTGILVGPSRETTATSYDYPPRDVTVANNVVDASDTDGSGSYGISFTGANDANVPATGCITGNVLRYCGDENINTTGAIYCHTTEGLSITGNTLINPTPIGISIYHDNVGFSCTGNVIVDPWSDGGSAIAPAIALRSNNNTGTISGNSLVRGGLTGKTSILLSGIRIDGTSGNNVALGPNHNDAATYVSDANADKVHYGMAAGSRMFRGSGSPESVITGVIGDMFLRTDGSTSTTLYIKTSGTGTTGWTAK